MTEGVGKGKIKDWRREGRGQGGGKEEKGWRKEGGKEREKIGEWRMEGRI